MDLRVGVIGAGSSGLAVAKNMLERGVAVECLEREDELGGNWCFGKPASSIYRSTHLISSKNQTEYTDFPMPATYPEYPSHTQVLDYLHSYANQFNLGRHIRFGSGVASACRIPLGGWNLTFDNGEERAFSHLVIANGHNWDPRYPDIPGEFGGLVLHSCEYKSPEVLAGKRVLVIGGGNSGCDIAVESSRCAEVTRLSLRRGYHILPKFFHGSPIDACGERGLRWGVPLPLRRLYASLLLLLVQGNAQAAGFPKPDHRLFECHPVINSEIVDAARHARLSVAPGVAKLTRKGVEFTDGLQEQFDVIVFATGFKISFPFIENSELNWQDDRPRLYLNLFHPDCDDLFVAGLIQPDSGQFGLVDWQAKCVAEYVLGLAEGRASAKRFQEKKRHDPPRLNGGVNYVDSPRHLLEVEHRTYRRALSLLYKQLNRRSKQA